MEDEAVHPRLSTVTYLTSGGAPTVIIEKALALLPPPAHTRTRTHRNDRTRRTRAREHTDAQARTHAQQLTASCAFLSAGVRVRAAATSTARTARQRCSVCGCVASQPRSHAVWAACALISGLQR